MRTGFVGAMTFWLTATGWALGQVAPPSKPGSSTALPATADPQPGKPAGKIEPLPTRTTDTTKPAGTTGSTASPSNSGSCATPNTPQANTGTTATGSGANQNQKKKVDLKDYHGGPDYKIWISADYLHWWTKPGPLAPALLSQTTPFAANPFAAPVVIGNGGIDYGDRNGARLSGGMWLDDCRHWAVEGGGFFLVNTTSTMSAGSDAAGNPALGRPIFDALLGQAATVPVSLPGNSAGSFSVASTSRLWGADTNLVRNLIHNCQFSADLLLGVRYLSLEEDLNISQSSTLLSATPPAGVIRTFPNGNGLAMPRVPGSVFTIADRFGTSNHFFGGQVGGRAEAKFGIVFVDMEAKVALGPNHEVVNVGGTSSVVPPGGASSTVPGGLLAVGSNSGRNTTNWFAVAPEVGVQVGCQLTDHVRAQFGYNFLYINSVARPGNQVNVGVNTGQVPTSLLFGSGSGPAQPTQPFRQEEFWAHGITAGMSFDW